MYYHLFMVHSVDYQQSETTGCASSWSGPLNPRPPFWSNLLVRSHEVNRSKVNRK